MKKLILIFLTCLLVTEILPQNVGIGTNIPHPSAALDITSTTGGLLIPRLSMTQRDGISSPAKGLIVFVTNDSSLYYYDGYWQKLVPSSLAWSVNGNTPPADSTYFIGTTNRFPFRIKVNNQYSGLIDTITQNHTWGYRALDSNTTGVNNTAIGNKSMFRNTSGFENVAVGNSTLFFNKTGYQNTAVGVLAMASNLSGEHNVGIGAQAVYFNRTGFNNVGLGAFALYSNMTGNFNTAVGQGSLFDNFSGSYNTAIGAGAASLSNNNNSTAIGANAFVDEDNKVVIGNSNVTKMQTAATVIANGYASKKTTSEILAIISPQEGTIIYNSTAKKPVYFDGTIWRYFNDLPM